MKTKLYPCSNKLGWFFALTMMVCFGHQSVFSQTQIVYHSFKSEITRSAGNNSMLSSVLGQSIFGVSKSNDIFIYTGYSLIGGTILSNVKTRNDIVPNEFALYQNIPNPFNPSTTIRYGLPVTSTVSLKIYNILGQQIAEIMNAEQTSGTHEIPWNANVASGIYFYRITAVSISEPGKKFTQLKKMVVLR